MVYVNKIKHDFVSSNDYNFISCASSTQDDTALLLWSILWLVLYCIGNVCFEICMKISFREEVWI